MKFQVGDRVAVYGRVKVHGGIDSFVSNGNTATVTEVHKSGWFTIQGLGRSNEHLVHPKQCRRLVKKERRKVWVGLRIHKLHPDINDRFYEARFEKPDVGFLTADGCPWVEFIEARKKK